MSQPKEIPLMEKVVSLCKRRGFIFQSSEIYGGINGFWDYGPLGAELKRNLRDTWWRAMTREREDVVGLDATIIMHPNIWKASGHVDTFSDPMVDCLVTKKRFRADHVEPQSGVVYKWSGATEIQGVADAGELPTSALAAIDAAGVSFSVLLAKGKPPESARKVAIQFYQQRGLKQPELLGETTASIENTRAFNPENGAQLTEPKPFNLMFHTFVGATATDADKAYL
ncbi:MAG TPA: glycine--tRNA ligase, partial [Chthoniobacteraceae bacterium]|nr:glycine--tRNA ligase [Chthoniobacteraceae bacterium]